MCECNSAIEHIDSTRPEHRWNSELSEAFEHIEFTGAELWDKISVTRTNKYDDQDSKFASSFTESGGGVAVQDFHEFSRHVFSIRHMFTYYYVLYMERRPDA